MMSMKEVGAGMDEQVKLGLKRIFSPFQIHLRNNEKNIL